MAYTRVNWEDAPSEKTPISAENLNAMDKGIADLDSEKLSTGGDVSNTTVKFSEATTLEAISSGSKLSTLFGAIAKAISSLISHLTDSVKHITSAERTAWNNKSDSGHKHTKSEITDFPSSMTPSAHNQAASTITAGTFAGQVKANVTAQASLTTAQLRDAVFAAEADAPEVGSTADTSKYPEGCLIVVVEAVS